ncbi:hypothetical protein LguiA_032484 [Lonicera macranthoides]
MINPKLASLPPPSFPEGQWSTGLYDCWDDKSNCLVTAFCPCITMGRIVEILDKGTTCWEANVKKWNSEGVEVPPIVASTMSR